MDTLTGWIHSIGGDGVWYFMTFGVVVYFVHYAWTYPDESVPDYRHVHLHERNATVELLMRTCLIVAAWMACIALGLDVIAVDWFSIGGGL